MKKLYFSLFLFISMLATGINSFAQLNAGDLAIVGYNTDVPTDSSDEFSFILLADVVANTSVFFTDFGWCSGVDITGFQMHTPPGSCGGGGALSDGVIKWTTSVPLSCGTQVRIKCQSNLSASIGTVTGELQQVSVPGTYMSLAAGGDQIFAFRGTLASPILITGFHMDGDWDVSLSQCELTSSKSTLPAALGASYSLFISPEVDNAAYNGVVTSASPSVLRTNIFNSANWNTNDGTPFTLPLPYSFSCAACVAPSVSIHPLNKTICVNANTSFTISASGTGLSYQWQVDAGGGFANIIPSSTYVNSTTNTLTVNGVTTAMSGNLYRCVVTGTCGTVNSNSGTLTVSAPSATNSKTDVLCFGAATGSATVNVSGGITPYTYSWSPSGGTSATANGLTANTYICTITDNNSCQTTSSVTINQPASALTADTTKTNVACFGGNNGTALVSPSGGTSPYTYLWSPGGATTAGISSLTAGNYSCLIKDANACQITRNFTISQPSSALDASTSKTDVTCNGGTNGTATVTPSGGTPSYTYQWSPGGATAATITGLAAGNYTCTIKDAHLCESVKIVNVGQPGPVQVGISPSAPSICAGASTPLFAIAFGGTGSFTYQWQPGNLLGDMQVVSPDVTTQYVVTATDANSCVGTDTVIVTVNANMAQSETDGDPIPGNAGSTSSQTAGGLQSFYNSTCGLIASLQENAALGTITMSVTVPNGVQVFAGRPYVARWYEIVPQNNLPAVVTLYFKQNDFDQYNAYATLNGFPLLPQNPTDVAGIDTLVITKVSGGTLGTGTATLITPNSVVWDATMEYWKVTFATPSFSEFYVHANNLGGTPLPVTYKSFEATKENRTAVLNWATASEQNNLGFNIERSTDGRQFTSIGWVATKAEQGNSTTSLSYRFIDKNPFPGKNYYRLQQKDVDGKFNYSIIRSVDFNNATAFQCYPNPTADLLNIEHKSDAAGTIQVRIVDITSRLVHQEEIKVQKGFNKNVIRLSGLPQGVYQMIISNNSDILFQSKIVRN